MLLRFSGDVAAAEDVYTELQYQDTRLEFDYYALCVFVIPSPLPGLKYRFVPLYILRRGVTQYQSGKLFRDRSGIKAGKFLCAVIYIG